MSTRGSTGASYHVTELSSAVMLPRLAACKPRILHSYQDFLVDASVRCSTATCKHNIVFYHRVAIVVEGCSVCLGHIDSGTPALLLHMSRDAEIVGCGDV
jgi:hypothetical protein